MYSLNIFYSVGPQLIYDKKQENMNDLYQEIIIWSSIAS